MQHFIHSAARVRVAAALIAGAAMFAACSSDDNTGTTVGAATSVSVVSGSTQTGTVGTGVTNALVVHVTDANGNAVANQTVTFTSSLGGTFSSNTVTTDASGNATINYTLGTRAGSDTVRASVNGASAPAMFTFTSNAGAATQLVQVSGNNQTATMGTILSAPFKVEVEDAYGNPVSGSTVTWTTSAGSLSGSAQEVTDNTGTATVGLQLPATAGPVTVTAMLQGTSATSTFTATAN